MFIVARISVHTQRDNGNKYNSSITTDVWTQKRHLCMIYLQLMDQTDAEIRFVKIIMPGFVSVCPQDDKITTFKIHVFWMKFKSIRAML